jgi:hypothetical protein
LLKVRRIVTSTVAGIGWALALLDVVGVVDLSIKQSQFALGVAMTLTAGVVLCVRRRPIGAAYDMGYAAGRRDAIRESSARPGRTIRLERKVVEPIRARRERDPSMN